MLTSAMRDFFKDKLLWAVLALAALLIALPYSQPLF
jgi:hypothetical protein